MKKYTKILAAVMLVIVLVLSAMPPAYANNSPFADVAPDHWAVDAISEAYTDGVMTGTGVNESGVPVFTPSGKLNMAQFYTVLTRAFYNEEVLNSTGDKSWPNPNRDVAQKHNLFAGIVHWTNDMEVTRDVMAQMMYNVMVDKGTVLPNNTEIQSTLNKIPDAFYVEDSYRTGVATCYYLELLSGINERGTFAPKGAVNRAQTAVIYVRLKKAISALSTGTTNPGVTNPGTVTDPGTTNSGTTTTPGTTTNPGTTQSGATLTNGMPVTVDNVLALIEEYRNGKEPGEKAKAAGFTSYAPGSSYDAYNPTYRIVLPSGGIQGTECAKFAYAFFDDIFGADAPIQEVANFADIRPGDLLRFSGHWSVVTSIEGLYVHDVGGGSTGRIGWTDLDVSIESSLVAAYTRYPQ